MTTAWALLVVSSEQQRESLADYLDMARQDAARNGWDLERIGDFVDVSSGKEGVRKTTTALIAALAATPPEQRPAWVWMRRVDRVGRGRATESMLALYAIHDLGVRIWDHDSGEVNLKTAEGELPAMLKAWFGRLENEIRSGKAKATYARKRAAGLPIGNKRPYGLVLKDGRDVPQEPQAEAVRWAFRLRCEGAGYAAIARWVASVAAPRVFADGSRRPMSWTPLRIRKLLQNRAYVGTIVDEVTFERARQIGREQAGRAPQAVLRHPWPLLGALRCFCGLRMAGTSTGKDGRFRYYICRSTRHPKPNRVRAEKLEAQFVEVLNRLRASPELVATYQRGATSAKLLDAAHAQAQAEVNGIEAERTRVWDLNARGLVRDEDVQPRLDALAQKRDAAKARVAEIERQRTAALTTERDSVEVAKIVAETAKRWKKATPERQQAFAKAIAVRFGGFTVRDGNLEFGVVQPVNERLRTALRC